MYRLVRLIGSSELGCVVVNSTVRASILRAPRRLGIREVVTPTLTRIEVRCVLFEHLFDVPDDSVGIKI